MSQFTKELFTQIMMSASFNSSIENIRTFPCCNIHAWLVNTGSTPPNGSFKLQASNENDLRINANQNANLVSTYVTHFVDVADSTVNIVAGQPNQVMWNIPDVGYTWIRCAYSASNASNATATARLQAKHGIP